MASAQIKCFSNTSIQIINGIALKHTQYADNGPRHTIIYGIAHKHTQYAVNDLLFMSVTLVIS